MADLRTEEEQLDLIKSWWKSNGKALIVGVVIALVAVFGWKYWQNHQAVNAAKASVTYQQLVTIAQSDSPDEKALNQAFELAAEIKGDHAGSLYADLAGLLETKLAVNAKDYAHATEALNGVVDNSKQSYLKALAEIDLARILLSQGQADAALKAIDKDVPDELKASQLDVKGDVFKALNKLDEAKKAYQDAQAAAKSHEQALYGTQLKLDDLGVEDSE